MSPCVAQCMRDTRVDGLVVERRVGLELVVEVAAPTDGDIDV